MKMIIIMEKIMIGIFIENHKWKNIGKKNTNLRHLIQPKLKELYAQLSTLL